MNRTFTGYDETWHMRKIAGENAWFTRTRNWRLLVWVFVFAACLNAQTPRREVTVAAAANLSDVFQQIGPAFEAATGVHPVFSFASTASIAVQIQNGAPFDVFTAADVAHIDQLEKASLLVSGSRAIYATGILALWIPPRSRASINRP